MTSLIKTPTKAFLAARQSHVKVLTANLISYSDGKFRMGRIKRQYLQKAPIIKTEPDGTVTIEGISNKQHPLAVPWIEPQHYSRVNPGEHGSGDLAIFPEPDPNRPRSDVAVNCQAYENASPEVRRLLSLEMSRRRDAVKVVKEDFRMNVAEHKHDVKSLEVKVSSLTVTIRNMQKELALKSQKGWRNNQMKHHLKILIDHRRGALARLRHVDYKKYEWLLEKLDLVYKPRPFTFENIIRRKHNERLVNLWCDEQRTFKLRELKDEFERDQPRFLRAKAETLRQIMKEEADLGLEASVKQEEIDECLANAEKIEKELSEKEKHPAEYHIFEKEVIPEEHVYQD